MTFLTVYGMSLFQIRKDWNDTWRGGLELRLGKEFFMTRSLGTPSFTKNVLAGKALLRTRYAFKRVPSDMQASEPGLWPLV